MRLVTLNVFGGKLMEPLLHYIATLSPTVDVFCFQEALSVAPSASKQARDRDLFSHLVNILDDFTGEFVPMQAFCAPEGPVTEPITMGLCYFVRKPFSVQRSSHLFTFGTRDSMVPEDWIKTFPCAAQYLEMEESGQRLTICHFHGISWWPKTDNPERIEQSRRIKDVLDQIDHSIILCGDFNMFEDTTSMRMLERGLQNMNCKYQIDSTRSSMHELEYKKSDYVLVSSRVRAIQLDAPPVLVSDHLPLIFDFEINSDKR